MRKVTSIKFNVGNENWFSLSFGDTVDIDIKFIRYNQSIPSVTIPLATSQ